MEIAWAFRHHDHQNHSEMIVPLLDLGEGDCNHCITGRRLVLWGSPSDPQGWLCQGKEFLCFWMAACYCISPEFDVSHLMGVLLCHRRERQRLRLEPSIQLLFTREEEFVGYCAKSQITEPTLLPPACKARVLICKT